MHARRLSTFHFLPAAGCALLCCGALSAAPDTAALKFFENEIRPLLARSCYECHGPQKKKSGLRLDNLAYILQGGESGPAIVKGEPDKSLLMEFLSFKDSDHEMPPDGKLPDKQIAALKKWIAIGAPWPEAEVAGAKVMHKPGTITDDDRKWWAYQPVKSSPVPKSDAKSPIDAFIRDRLAKEGLKASPEASRTELIRRLSFDLTGLPPSPGQVTAFVEDKRPDAYERLVDELLASPRFGERQAQQWLDLVRYAESEGYRQDAYRPNVWPYRDYVIKSFNDDKPYDQFMREQIAGDEIAPGDPAVTIGTAFLRHTAYEYNQRDAEGQWRTIINEVTDVTGDVFLGTSMQCAQCHDHKFDPIMQKDYYRLQAFLNNITWQEHTPLATPAQLKQYNEQYEAWQAATVEPRKIIDGIIEPRITGAQKSAMKKFPPEVFAMYEKPRGQRTPYEEQIVQLAWRQAEFERVRFKEEKMKPDDAAKLAEARAELAKFDHLKPKPLLDAFIIGEAGREAMPASFKTRKVGWVKSNPGVLTILDPADAHIPEPPPSAQTSGRRSALADWFARPDNPLTTRVIVNRIWQHHFGRGIVGTSSDFGRLGERPTHPELLDWLTSEFVKGGWHMKPLHKMIVMSETYRQATKCSVLSAQSDKADRVGTEHSQSALLIDPENRFLWRYPPRRLDAEQARDAVLAASGELKLDMGGEGVSSTTPRRSIYTKKIRNTQDEFLRSLDAPAGYQSIAERQATTTATQSLLLINGEWPLDRARAMAASLLKSKPKDDAALVRAAYLRAFSREPTVDDAKSAAAFLGVQRAQLKREAPPPPPAAAPLADAVKFFGLANASKTAKALMMKPGTANEKLRVNLEGAPEPDSFAIEAVVYLDSLYPNAAVRTIAARWNNAKTEPGWCFGVTSEKSAYKPNNLIVQLSGDDFQGSQLYEVVASNITIPLRRPFYVAAAINNHPAEGQQFGGTVTFYARDLGDPAAPMQTATVSHQVCGGYVSAQRALYIGGRETDKSSLWDGAIARVAIRKGALDSGKLMAWAGMTDPTCILDMSADQFTAAQKAPAGQKWTFESSMAPAPKGGAKLDPALEAVTDLCHALLNSNEFFYLQ
ncbi:MAG: PSD1 and planctomycete cytochrome C domain-containing protein [Verrucomicrobiaceae bacterium]|nr:PSD1 and planctomycete cytochrome C domain-containing protein [Verrucomicrobiaceae bacterium]